MSDPSAPMQRIRQRFLDEFGDRGCELPDPLPADGSFECGEWGFRFVVNDCDGDVCLDVVAQVRGSEQLLRFLASGELESGPDFWDMVIFDPELDSDGESARRRFDEHNAAVGDRMRERRLL